MSARSFARLQWPRRRSLLRAFASGESLAGRPEAAPVTGVRSCAHFPVSIGLEPVLDPQSPHPAEVTHVAGDERQVAGQHDRDDAQVGLGQPAPGTLEPRPQRPVLLRSRLVEGENRLRGEEDGADSSDELVSAVPRRAVEKLAERDRRRRLLGGGRACEPPDEVEAACASAVKRRPALARCAICGRATATPRKWIRATSRSSPYGMIEVTRKQRGALHADLPAGARRCG